MHNLMMTKNKCVTFQSVDAQYLPSNKMLHEMLDMDESASPIVYIIEPGLHENIIENKSSRTCEPKVMRPDV